MAKIDSFEQIKNIVKSYADILKTELDISGVYIFGSHIRGDFTEDSYIDVLIVSNDFTGDVLADTFNLMKLRRKIDIRIEPHPCLGQDFNDNNPFFRGLKGSLLKVA